jgi:hypothetical protein
MAVNLYGIAMEIEICRTFLYAPGVSTSDRFVRVRPRIEVEAATI